MALSGGVATLSVSSLPVGTVTLNAVYSGDWTFRASTSANLPGTVLSPDFALSSTPSVAERAALAGSELQHHGDADECNVCVSGEFSVSGLPSGVTGSFNPSSIAAGSGATSTTLTLTASASAAACEGMPWGTGGASALALLLLPFAANKRTRKTARRMSRLLLVLLALGAVGVLSGCGTGGFFGHQKVVTQSQ